MIEADCGSNLDCEFVDYAWTFGIDDLIECFIGYQDAHAASPNGEQAI